ncbi:MAG: FAD/NAD(P)-binding oxidoreductase [bacterium]
MKRLLILGAGTAGTMMAHKMRRKLKVSEWDITVIDKSEKHFYQPGLIFVPFKLYGYTGEKGNIKNTRDLLPKDVNFVSKAITRLDPENNRVETADESFEYDWLILGLGCRIAPEEVPGLEAGYGKNVFYYYTMPSALDMQKALEDFDGGKLVLNITEYPIKCPVAPIEFICLADYFFHLKGIRHKVDLELVTSAQGVFTKPVAGRMLGDMFKEKGIKVTPNFTVAEVRSDQGKIISHDGKEVQFDFLASIPPNVGAGIIDEAGMGNGNGYALTHPNTLKSQKYNNIYVIGDCTNVNTSKAGSVAHFQAGIVERNILREIEGKDPLPDFDGHSNCFIETGFKKAHLIDFNYKQEPIPGRFPLPTFGPFSLLKETRLNHMGKLFFRWFYWNMLLSDMVDMEMILPTSMSYLGKDLSYVTK